MRDSGIAQSEIIERVYEVANHYGIRVRHDQYEPHTGPCVAAAADPPAADPPAADPPAADPPAADPPAADPPAADPPAADPPAADPPAADPPAAASGGKRGRRAKKKKTAPVPVAYVRRRDGTHQLAVGRIGPAPADDVASVAPARNATVGRLVLSVDKRGGARAAAPLAYECNGLVIDARTWRALAVPPGAFNTRPVARLVDEALAEGLYDVVRVDDGTVVTLYCWEHPTAGPTWALASSNAYDVSSLCWFGPSTYACIFSTLARILYPEFVAETGMSSKNVNGTWQLDFKNLDRTRCYTVGFRSHSFHPMLADPQRFWQIQSADLSGDIPRIDFSGSGHGLPGIPDQYVYPGDFLGGKPTLESLRVASSDALTRAVAYTTALWKGMPPRAARHGLSAEAYYAVGRCSHDKTLPAELNYGYILRSRDPARTKDHSDILIASPLLKRVRKVVYERAPRSVCDSLTADERLEYNAIRAFLTATDRNDFLALFPDWTDRFRAYGEFTSNVTRLIVHALRQRALAPASREPALESPTGRIARTLLKHINQHEQLSAFHGNTESIVNDYVVNPEYAFLYLRAMPKLAGPAGPPPPPAAAEPV
jgi:hypothetical protein